MFESMGNLKSVTFLGRDSMGGDVYNLAFANGVAVMSAALDTDGRMADGILRPLKGSAPTAGTEAALRSLVAGEASGSPDYDRLSPRFAEIVRRQLPVTHPMLDSMGELKSVTFLGRGDMGDDTYNLVFANGGAIMSAGLDTDGRMAGGILRLMTPPKR
jgi:hypothetical protein